MEKHPPFIISHGIDSGFAAHEVTTASNSTDARKRAQAFSNQMESSYAVYRLHIIVEPEKKSMAERKKFWMVFSPEGISPPKKEYPTEGEANTAAQAMAEKHPTQQFFVMEAKKGFKATAISEIKMT